MFERKAIRRFKRWKETRGKQALLVTGARQVGKSFLIRRFCEEEYDNVVYFDFVENPGAAASFAQASNLDDLLFRMSILADKPLSRPGTVVVFDEVQECPEVVSYIKYLVDRGDCDYILSGSLLGVALEGVRSLPVGYLTEVRMYPLDFEEFCWAHGLPHEVFPGLASHVDRATPLPAFLHDRLASLFRSYLIVGGMPAAVMSYREHNDIEVVRDMQHDIHRLYREDIAKYAPAELRLVIRNIYDLVPSQLLAENRRFRLSSIPEVKRFASVQDNFLWLENAGVALSVSNVTQPTSPLLANTKRSLFKLFLSDVGLLTSTYAKRTANDVMMCESNAAVGGIYENFVAQELVARGFAAKYYSSKQIGELDFVTERADGTVLVFEVKSGKTFRSHAALDNVLRRWPGEDIRPFVLCNSNIERVGSVTYLPAYMAGVFEAD